MVGNCLEGAGHHVGHLETGRITVGLLTATGQGGAQLAGAKRAEVSEVDKVVGTGRATGAWVAQVTPKGVGGEVSRVAAVGHFGRRCEFS